MAYLAPAEFVTKMVDAGESKLLMSTRDTLIRAYMAGAILALAAAFAVSITVNTGNPLIGALLFPVGFCMLYLMGFDLLTGVFTLAPLAVFDKRPGANETAFCVDPQGRTVDVRTVKQFPGDPKIDEICRDTVKTWRFKPFLVAGKPTRTCSVQVFNLTFK